jgi:hypothetical protein
MNRETVLHSANASESAPSPARAASPLAEEPVQSATLAFTGADASARVIEQLDKLAGSLESIASQHRDRPALAAAADEEECLESYLQKYMQQLTGKGAEKPVEQTTTTNTTPPASTSSPTTSEPSPPAQRQPAQAPEDRLTISAMRELANDSARRAMAESTQIQLAVKTRMTYLGAKATSLVSSTLAVAYFPTRSTIALACATVFFVVACALGLRFVGLCRKLGRVNATAQ